MGVLKPIPAVTRRESERTLDIPQADIYRQTNIQTMANLVNYNIFGQWEEPEVPRGNPIYLSIHIYEINENNNLTYEQNKQ